MAYTSGRTVKSSKRQGPTTVAGATADARRLVRRHLGNMPGVTIDSSKTAHMVTLDPQVRTVITFPGVSRDVTRPLADAIEQLSGYSSMAWTEYGISLIRTV